MQATDTLQRVGSSFISKNQATQSPAHRGSPSIARGHWKPYERQRYISFLKRNYSIMRCSRLRYHYKIFNSMALQIGTRTSAQCKSHHQKMLKKAGDRIQNLILAEGFSSPIPMKEEEPQGIQRMASEIITDQKRPYFMVESRGKLLIVIDDRFIGSY